MPRKRKTGLRNLLDKLTGDNNAAFRANVVAFAERRSTLSYEEKNTRRADGRRAIKVGIIPFYILPGELSGTTMAVLASDTIPVPATKQALDIGKTLGSADSANMWERGGIQLDVTKIGGERLAGFYPALARISMTGVTSTGTDYIDATKTSHITGRQYKLAKRRSGSLPFGRSFKAPQEISTNTAGAPAFVGVISESDYGEVKNAIEGLISAYNSANNTMVASASYEPEVVRESIRIPSKGIAETDIGTITL